MVRQSSRWPVFGSADLRLQPSSSTREEIPLELPVRMVSTLPTRSTAPADEQRNTSDYCSDKSFENTIRTSFIPWLATDPLIFAIKNLPFGILSGKDRITCWAN